MEAAPNRQTDFSGKDAELCSCAVCCPLPNLFLQQMAGSSPRFALFQYTYCPVTVIAEGMMKLPRCLHQGKNDELYCLSQPWVLLLMSFKSSWKND